MSNEVVKAQENNPALMGNNTVNIDVTKPDQAIQVFDNAQVVPVNVSVEGWSPEKVGEALVGIFVGITTVPMPSLKVEGEMEQVKTAEFFVKEDVTDMETGEIVGAKLAKRSIASKRAVSFFEDKPTKTMWRVVFAGEKKNKTNSKKSYVFEFYQMVANQEG